MRAVNFEILDSIAKISFNRPDVYNAFNQEMADLTIQYLDICKDNDAIRVVYITGIGKAFCAGQDLKEAPGDIDAEFISESVDKKYNPIVRRIFNLQKPVIAAVNGIAVGAGANLALVCDVVVAKESAYFAQVFSKIGLIPDSGGTYIMPRLVGYQRALALAYFGDKVGAKEAVSMGMIYKSFTDEEFEIESWKLALTLADLPTKALGLTKRAILLGATNTFDEQLEVERTLQSEAGITADFKEGVLAFTEKRKPNFTGK